MSKFTLKQSLKIQYILLTALYLSSPFLSVNVFSMQHWKSDYITIMYHSEERSIDIECQFFDYEFGAWGEHAYLEFADFYYFQDNHRHKRILRCLASDQVMEAETSIVTIKDKLAGATIQLLGCEYPKSGTMWQDKTIIPLEYVTISRKASFQIKWLVPPDLSIQYIYVSGKWLVNGLHCYDEIKVNYPVLGMEASITELNTDLSQKYVNQSCLDQPDKIASVQVYKDADAVVLKGAPLGEHIIIYSATGSKIHSAFANGNLIKIKLPVNQIYIVKVGQARYKVAIIT